MKVIYSCQHITNEAKFVKTQQAIIHAGKYRSGYAFQCAIDRMQQYNKQQHGEPPK